jgi:histidine triad (HIT) family protein
VADYFANSVPVDDGKCDFCGIISGRIQERTIRYQDDDLMVFKNALPWVPVMFLIVPKLHMKQGEFWKSPLFAQAAALAVKIGQEDSPDGFRLVSNFGEKAAQTQLHGHLHVLGGGELGLYMDFPSKGDYWLRRSGYTEFFNRPRRRRQQQQAGQLQQQVRKL